MRIELAVRYIERVIASISLQMVWGARTSIKFGFMLRTSFEDGFDFPVCMTQFDQRICREMDAETAAVLRLSYGMPPEILNVGLA